MFSGIIASLTSGKITDDQWQSVEESLLAADMGIQTAESVVLSLKKFARQNKKEVQSENEIKEVLRNKLVEELEIDKSREINFAAQKPTVILVVGVNGVGKTTTIGKLASSFKDKQVILGAADTFRAAAGGQLETWAQIANVDIVRSERENADSASVAFDAVKTAKEQSKDIVMIDTAGRLHNKANLMQELSKVKRVIEKVKPIDEVLLVIDATTGQTAFSQAKQFLDTVGVTGIVLTKLDGSAKGGIIFKVQRELQVPVKFIGVGEGVNDLIPFEPTTFVEQLVG
jgi:fused signal recognition particle receptor